MSEMKRLDELCTIELSSIDKKSKTNEKPVKLCNFVDVYNNWNIYPNMTDSFMYATASDKNIDIFSLKKNDVLITKDSETRDDIGMSACVYDDLDNTVLGYHCALIRPKENLVGSYLNAFLNSPLGRKYFSNQASGSGQRYTLTKDAIGAIKVPAISVSKQEKIGNIFSNIDIKIAENQKISAELESMAKLLYDYWFVQFDFPDKNGNPYKSSGGKMIWNEELKREIPEGWKKTTLEKLALYVDEKIKNSDLDKNTYIGTDNLLPNMQGRSLSDYLPNDGQSTMYKSGDTLIANIRPYFKKIWFADGCGGCSPDVLCIRARKPELAEYIYSTLSRDAFFDYDMAGAKGSKMPRGDKGHIMAYPIATNEETAVKFSKFQREVLKEIEQRYQENQQLTSLRDFLLPMLMNGQVKIK